MSMVVSSRNCQIVKIFVKLPPLFKTDSGDLVSCLKALQFGGGRLEFIGNGLHSTSSNVSTPCVVKMIGRVFPVWGKVCFYSY